MALVANRTVYTYQEYLDLTARLLEEGKTTGENHSEDMLHYTRMNQQRMKRLDKKVVLTSELENVVQNLDHKYTLLVLTEAWCGDAAQNVPIMAKIADSTPNIEIRLVLRDENLDLMDQYLTNGGRSIPKMIIIDETSGDVEGTWGPRPAPVQEMVMARKAMTEKPPYSEFVVEVQKWYNKDKTATAQQELLEVFKDLK